MLQALSWLTFGAVIGIACVSGWITVEQIFEDFVAPLRELLWQIRDYFKAAS